jgi:hypothetical protein
MRNIIQRWIHTVYMKRDVTVITEYQSSFIIPLSTAFTHRTVQTPPPFLKDNLSHLKLVFQISVTKFDEYIFLICNYSQLLTLKELFLQPLQSTWGSSCSTMYFCLWPHTSALRVCECKGEMISQKELNSGHKNLFPYIRCMTATVYDLAVFKKTFSTCTSLPPHILPHWGTIYMATKLIPLEG